MELEIIDFGMNGEGVAKSNGKTVLVLNAVKGDLVEASIIKDYGNYMTAKTDKIIKKSINRISPVCENNTECGGCCLQNIDYNTQLKFKQNLIQKTIKKITNIETKVNDCVPSKQFNYRNKASFAIDENSIGMFCSSSHNVLDISQCHLVKENINLIFNLFKDFVKQNNLKGYNRETKTGIIKNVVIREISNQILVGVVVTKQIDLSEFYKILKTKFNQIGLYEFINTRNDSVILTDKSIHIDGIKSISITNNNIHYSIDLLSFSQTNTEIQDKLYNKILTYINDSVVVNGFSGAGLLSAIISTKAKTVYGIEIVKEAHANAEKLKQENNINNMHNILGDFNKEFIKLKSKIGKIDTVILDPSKKGCGEKVMKNLIGAKNIIYVSCNPIALAKDLREIINDYNIDEITPFDMFPNTNNVETLVKLSKKQ